MSSSIFIGSLLNVLLHHVGGYKPIYTPLSAYSTRVDENFPKVQNVFCAQYSIEKLYQRHLLETFIYSTLDGWRPRSVSIDFYPSKTSIQSNAVINMLLVHKLSMLITGICIQRGTVVRSSIQSPSHLPALCPHVWVTVIFDHYKALITTSALGHEVYFNPRCKELSAYDAALLVQLHRTQLQSNYMTIIEYQ